MSSIVILESLKNQLAIFLGNLQEQFPNDYDISGAKTLIENNIIDIRTIMEYFVIKLLPWKSMIVERKDDFFLKNNVLFEEFNMDKVNYFKKIWESNVDSDTKDNIWKWFDVFIKMTEKYSEFKIREERVND